jgi:hypothetical protein
MSPTAFAKLAALHEELARVYSELATTAPPGPAEDRALGLSEAAAMLGKYAKKIE